MGGACSRLLTPVPGQFVKDTSAVETVTDIDENGKDIIVPINVTKVFFRGDDGTTYTKSYEQGDEDAILYSPQRLRGKNLMLYVADGYVYGYTVVGDGGGLPKDIGQNAKGEYWLRGNPCQAINKAGSTMKIVNIVLVILSTLSVVGVGLAFGVALASLLSLVCCILFVIVSLQGRRALERHYVTQTGEVGYRSG
jgi:hypothetical protein